MIFWVYLLENINSWARYETLKYAKKFSCQLSNLPLEKRNTMPAKISLFKRNFYPMVRPKIKWAAASHSQEVWDISAKDPIPSNWPHNPGLKTGKPWKLQFSPYNSSQTSSTGCQFTSPRSVLIISKVILHDNSWYNMLIELYKHSNCWGLQTI